LEEDKDPELSIEEFAAQEMEILCSFQQYIRLQSEKDPKLPRMIRASQWDQLFRKFHDNPDAVE
jgi:hypothetical protein